MYAIRSYYDLNTPERMIITVEDPIEYSIHGINQIQAKPQIGLTFANALRSIVRQDPDVIMIGEMRDTETAEIAVVITSYSIHYTKLYDIEACGSMRDRRIGGHGDDQRLANIRRLTQASRHLGAVHAWHSYNFV